MDLNIGIAGVGNFAKFAAKVFLEIPGIKIIAITDINKNLLVETAAEWNVNGYEEYDSFLDDKQIDLVYIATPPFLHYEQSKKALLKGKHVICEKPAAIRSFEAIELAALADSVELLWVVNLMQRYNPLYEAVKSIVSEKILGDFLHGFFENYASDENLDKDHWFWSEEKSGGIFIEHGVHFFDMFSGWFGDGKLVNALQIERPGIGKKIIDRVQSTVIYNNASVNFYHGFDQPKILDRQEIRLLFEKGEITMNGWIPVKMRLHGLLKNEQLDRLGELVGKFTIVMQDENKYSTNVKGRFKDISYDTHISMECGDILAKQDRYEELLKAMLLDQWKWIHDRKHYRVIDSNNAMSSLQIAEQANMMAKKSE